MAITDELPTILQNRWANLDLLRGARTPTQFRRELDMNVSFLKFFTRSDARRPVGEQVARQVETRLRLPALWLDQPHTAEDVIHAGGVALRDEQVTARPALPGSPDAVNLAGLPVLQTALIVTLEKLCRAGKMPDKTVVQLLASWEGLLD